MQLGRSGHKGFLLKSHFKRGLFGNTFSSLTFVFLAGISPLKARQTSCHFFGIYYSINHTCKHTYKNNALKTLGKIHFLYIF